MSLEARSATEEADITRCLEAMRAKLTTLEKAAPGLARLTADVRLEMMSLVGHVNALRATQAAKRMTGEASPLIEQEPVNHLPLFAHEDGHVLTPLDVGRMRETLHRTGDYTMDDEEEVV